MVDKNQPMTSAPPEDDNEDEALQRRLVSRIAVAGVVIVALLGGLALIDALNTPSPPPVAKAPPVVPPSPPQEAAKPDEAASEPPKEEAAAETEEPAKTAEAPQEGSTAPSSAAHPVAPAIKPLTKPATPQAAMLKPAAPVAPPVMAPTSELGHARQAPLSAAGRHAPPSRPLSQVPESQRRYVVQMGVFNNLANAEELRAKLELNGIPAQIEARVQVGPFGSKEEADEARKKLVALGLEPGLLMAIRK
ncbi:SPOR domain-containing protein [Denitratisoma sp. DHT3]|uniref:SPOR domain-containing protein n=1 Tax=Denitratisoma sp. DHT3 TaxID=1981880 RepID=UPI0016443C90|nr:SPOR domain-containing protein [Denitratisoma sp. DHT3]